MITSRHKIKYSSNPKPNQSMKKVLCALVVMTLLFGTVSSCTDENVQPRTNENGGSTGVMTDTKG
jgi:hypothetical protein